MKLQLLVGMIGSGKSTYCRGAAKHGVICINDDAIVNMLHGDDYTLYDENLKILYKSIENHIVGTSLAMNRDVIIDRGLSISVHGRRRWIAMARSFDVPCEAIVFPLDTPEVHAGRRAENDTRGHSRDYWLMVAIKHRNNYVEPSLEEGFDTIKHISFEDILSGNV